MNELQNEIIKLKQIGHYLGEIDAERKNNGETEDEKKQIYEKSYTMREPNYLNLLMTLSKNGKFPSMLLKILVNTPTVNILNSRPMKPLFKSLYVGMKSAYKLAKRLTGRAVE